MIVHAQRAAASGAKAASVAGAIAGLALAMYESAESVSFEAIALKYGVSGLLAGALLGAILFGLLGFCVALLGVKRVGWTFTYTIFGAALFALAAFWLQPLTESFSTTLAGLRGAAFASIVGAISGAFVAGGLRAGPDV